MNKTKKLRADLRIEGEHSGPLVPRGTLLPVEAHHVISNAYKIPERKIHLLFGDNETVSDNVSLGSFNLEVFPLASEGGPSHVNVKISISSDQEICIAILDPSTSGYRSVGFNDFSKIEPPVVIPRASQPSGFSGISSILTDLFGDNRIGHMPIVGTDISYGLTISFDEALHGVQKHIEIPHTETCPACAGSGIQPGAAPAKCTNCQGTGLEKKLERGVVVSVSTCSKCRGDGQIVLSPCISCQGRTWVQNKRPLTLNIPVGIDSGAQICFPNQGEMGRYGGRSGHLYIIVTVAKHPLFTRIGHDIFIHLPVSARLANEGGQLQVPGVGEEGFYLLNLPSNARSGAVFRVFGDESYTLNAIIETCRPYNFVALLKARKRLRAIKKALGFRDFEIRVQK